MILLSLQQLENKITQSPRSFQYLSLETYCNGDKKNVSNVFSIEKQSLSRQMSFQWDDSEYRLARL